MTISIKYSTIKEMMDKKVNQTLLENYFSWHTISTISKGSYDDTYVCNVNLGEHDKKSAAALYDFLSNYDIPQKTMSTIKLWIDNLNNPADAVISSLQNLDKVFKQAIKASKLSWIFRENPDGNLVPYYVYVEEAKYRGRTRDDDASFSFKIGCSRYVSSTRLYGNENEEIEIKSDTQHVYFYKSDVRELDEDDLAEIFEQSGSDDYDDDENDGKKKKTAKKPAKKGEYRFSSIMAKKGFYLMTDELFKKYTEQLAEMVKISKEQGKVFTATGKAYVISDSKNAYSSWRNINVDDKISRLVIDSSGEKSTSQQSPLHPYILAYNLTQYAYACVHVDALKPYEFDNNIIDKLVMSDKKKELLSALIQTENNFSDIVVGKSGGIIILASGEAGLGKTLTAEVYAELMNKPLYSIQSAQLGIKIEEIEQKLNKILFRTEKWGAVLLIDEADSYVHKRGNDMHQNCIVGTFLRLLEYFNGVLFLTTNRADIVDDAIMSRVTAHVKYDYPTEEEAYKLWHVLADNFKIKVTDATIKEILKKYEPMSGRDIRNFMKMAVKTKTKEVSVQTIENLAEFLPFVKSKQSS